MENETFDRAFFETLERNMETLPRTEREKLYRPCAEKTMCWARCSGSSTSAAATLTGSMKNTADRSISLQIFWSAVVYMNWGIPAASVRWWRTALPAPQGIANAPARVSFMSSRHCCRVEGFRWNCCIRF